MAFGEKGPVQGVSTHVRDVSVLIAAELLDDQAAEVG